MKKSLSSYTDCSIHLFFMYSLENVRGSPQKKSQNHPILFTASVRSSASERSSKSFRVSTPAHTLTSALFEVERCVRAYQKAYGAQLAGADPASRPAGVTRAATSALQRRLAVIEDLAIKAVGNGDGAAAARMRLLDLEGDTCFGRTLIQQSPVARAPAWSKVILNRLGEAAKLAQSVRSERALEAQSCAPCI